jgi:hypothetical protein
MKLSAALVAVAIAMGCASDAPRQAQSPSSEAPARGAKSRTREQKRILDMLSRSYYPGRTGQIIIVPREGDVITRPDPDYEFMHGSPWSYDVAIPLLFVGPAVKAGMYKIPASQQDVAPTLAEALGVRMPGAVTGHALPVLREGRKQPSVVMLLVLDGMRRDYFERYADTMPTLTGLRKRGAWFSNAQLSVLPSNTAVGHSTLSTGTDPSVHGITGVNMYDFNRRERHDFFAGCTPQELMAPTLSDILQRETAGRAVIVAQGSVERAATPLAGHGACQLNGTAVVMAAYDQQTGAWTTNPECFRLPDYLKEQNARTFWPADGQWMHHKVDTPSAIRFSALFPAFEADAMIAMIEHEPLGQDEVPDLILMNYKCADFVGHKYGPDSPELRATLGEMDRHLARILAALEAKVGSDYLLAVTADHGMPSEPASPERRHLAPSIVDLLHEKFDPGEKALVTSYESENGQIFIDEARLSHLGLTLHDLTRFLDSQPFVFVAFTREDIQQR